MYSFLAIFVIGVSAASADICDLCVCEKTKCDSPSAGSEFVCKRNVSDSYRCDGSSDHFKRRNAVIELDNIQWPVVGDSVLASFNNLQLTYLTK